MSNDDYKDLEPKINITSDMQVEFTIDINFRFDLMNDIKHFQQLGIDMHMLTSDATVDLYANSLPANIGVMIEKQRHFQSKQDQLLNNYKKAFNEMHDVLMVRIVERIMRRRILDNYEIKFHPIAGVIILSVMFQSFLKEFAYASTKK